jgi:hypothetical protein
MFYPLLILFLIFLAVGEAAFCGPAFRVSRFGDSAGLVHSIKKTSSVFYGNSGRRQRNGQKDTESVGEEGC